MILYDSVLTTRFNYAKNYYSFPDTYTRTHHTLHKEDFIVFHITWILAIFSRSLLHSSADIPLIHSGYGVGNAIVLEDDKLFRIVNIILDE